MTATKISELTATTTPDKDVQVAVVESGSTKRTTIDQAVSAVLGWFNVGHNGSGQTGIGTSETQLLVDGLGTNQGGYSHLPNGVSSTDAYDSSDSRIKLGWLDEGQAIAIRIDGELTTTSANTAATMILRFYDSDDNALFDLNMFAAYVKSASSGNTVMTSYAPIYISSSLASGGYCKAFIQFDTGASNEVDMGGFSLAVLA